MGRRAERPPEQRSADGKPERLPGLTAELVRLQVDVIFATNTPVAQAARKATSTTPIVFARVADPPGVGLVANLARPGGDLVINLRAAQALGLAIPQAVLLRADGDHAPRADRGPWDSDSPAATPPEG